MPRSRTGNPPGRPKGKREADTHAYVRMTSEERRIIEAAIDLKMQTATSGVRISVSGLMLDAGIREALNVLVRQELSNFLPGEVMDPEGVLARLNLGPNMKYPVLGVLRELATAGLLKQHSATDFFRPEPTT
jgi:hypothetical protein